MPDSGSPLPIEEALRVLLKEERRRVIRTLDARQHETTVDQLATALCETPPATDRRNRTVDDVLVDLQHVHIPVLRDEDVITYDPRDETVRRGDQFQPVSSLLEVIDEHHDGVSTDPL